MPEREIDRRVLAYLASVRSLIDRLHAHPALRMDLLAPQERQRQRFHDGERRHVRYLAELDADEEGHPVLSSSHPLSLFLPVLKPVAPVLLEEPRREPDRKNAVVVLLLPPSLVAVVAGEGDLHAKVEELAEKGLGLPQ